MQFKNVKNQLMRFFKIHLRSRDRKQRFELHATTTISTFDKSQRCHSILRLRSYWKKSNKTCLRLRQYEKKRKKKRITNKKTICICDDRINEIRDLNKCCLSSIYCFHFSIIDCYWANELSKFCILSIQYFHSRNYFISKRQ